MKIRRTVLAAFMAAVVAAATAGAAETYTFDKAHSDVGFQIRHLVSDGDIVLTERVDVFEMGDKAVSLPVMGTFEVRDGKIAAWRDYFDMATITSAFS